MTHDKTITLIAPTGIKKKPYLSLSKPMINKSSL